MKITCPEHPGLIYVDLGIFNEKNKRIKKVVLCPVCDDEVVINGIFDFDSEGVAAPVNQ